MFNVLLFNVLNFLLINKEFICILFDDNEVSFSVSVNDIKNDLLFDNVLIECCLLVMFLLIIVILSVCFMVVNL